MREADNVRHILMGITLIEFIALALQSPMSYSSLDSASRSYELIWRRWSPDVGDRSQYVGDVPTSRTVAVLRLQSQARPAHLDGDTNIIFVQPSVGS